MAGEGGPSGLFGSECVLCMCYVRACVICMCYVRACVMCMCYVRACYVRYGHSASASSIEIIG